MLYGPHTLLAIEDFLEQLTPMAWDPKYFFSLLNVRGAGGGEGFF